MPDNIINALPVNSIISSEPINSIISAESSSVIISAEPINSIIFDDLYIPDFDDNRAAIAGGLESGELYRTPDQKIKVVKNSNILLDFGNRLSLLWRAFW